MAALVRSAVAAGVATLTLDSPENRNALSHGLITDLTAAIAGAVADADVRVIVLSHTGRVFCSGADLKEARGADAASQPAAAIPTVLAAVWDAPKPVVARVGGPVRAGGLGLLGACDIVVCAEDATFAFTEVRLGLVPAVISPTVLPRLVPRAAQELYLTGDVFDGRRAAEIGLATVAVPPDRVDDEVDRYVSLLLRGGPGALAGIKALLRTYGARRPIADELAELSAVSVHHFTSEEGQEGITAFAERREPRWVPR